MTTPTRKVWVEIDPETPGSTMPQPRFAVWVIWAFPAAVALLVAVALVLWLTGDALGDLAVGFLAGVVVSALVASMIRMVTP